MDINGVCVVPRSGHTMAALEDDSSAFLMGGYDGNQRFADAYLWADDQFSSLQLMGANTPPFVGRAGHVMVRTGGSTLFVALGYESDRTLLGDAMRVTLDVDARQAKVEPLSWSGKARRWASAGLVGNNAATVCVAGGWDEKGPTMDVSLYDVLRDTWNNLTITGPGPKPRRWAASGKYFLWGQHLGPPPLLKKREKKISWRVNWCFKEAMTGTQLLWAMRGPLMLWLAAGCVFLGRTGPRVGIHSVMGF